GSRPYFGALLVGYHENGRLMYAGKVGTGVHLKKLRALHARFPPYRQKECPFANLPTSRRSRFGQSMTASVMRTITWLRPELVAQIKFAEWTDEGALRQPVFLGMRDDKSAKDVVREATAAEDRGRRTEDGGRKTEDGGQRTEDRGRKTEDGEAGRA